MARNLVWSLHVLDIGSKGPYTKESLKAYKSLEAYNYFYNGYVRTVYHYGVSSSKFSILKAKVNPSQKAADQNHEAWVVISKESGMVNWSLQMYGRVSYCIEAWGKYAAMLWHYCLR